MPDSKSHERPPGLEVGGHRILENVKPQAKSGHSTPEEVSLDSATGNFSHMVSGIRRYRDESARNEAARHLHFEEDWKTVVKAMHDLRAQVEKHPRVRYFTFSRDEAEISVKINDSSSRRFSYLILARRHPEKDYGKLDRVWLINLGFEETHYEEPLDAMLEMVGRIASLLA